MTNIDLVKKLNINGFAKFGENKVKNWDSEILKLAIIDFKNNNKETFGDLTGIYKNIRKKTKKNTATIQNEEAKIEREKEIKDMRIVNIYVKESCDVLASKKGNYTVLLETDNKSKTITREIADTTNYRMILHGAIDAIAKLGEASNINLYAGTHFGMSRIRKANGGWKTISEESNKANKDLLNELKDLVVNNGHYLNNFYGTDIINKKLGVEKAYKQTTTKSGLHKVFVGLSEELNTDLEARAKETGLSKENIIRFALNQYLYGNSQEGATKEE